MVAPRLVCIPSSDAVFAADAERIAARIPTGLRPDEALAWFRAQLQRTYPAATVREQEDLARTGDTDVVWYVSRPERRFRIDTGVVVPLPQPQAFQLYVERVVEWQSAVELVPRMVAPEIVGTAYEATYRFVGRRYRGTLRVVAADPPRSVALEAEGSGIRVWYETTFTPDDDATRMWVRGDYELPENVIARVADRLVLERAIGRDIERANETYRAMCERVAREAPPR